MLLQPLAHRQRPRRPRRSRSSAGTFGGGGGGGVPRMFSSSHLPRSTGDVRFGYDVTVRMLPWPSRPPRGSSVERDAAEVAAVDVRNAVVPRQPLVDERVVGGQQLERRCDPRAAGCRRTARSRAGTPRAGSRRSRETGPDPASTSPTLRRSSHWPAKFVDERLRRADRPASAAPAARAPPDPSACPRSASVEQLVVGNAAPQEERQARRELEVADAVRPRRRGAGRIALDAEQELRADEQPLERQLDARVEARRSARPVRVERRAAAARPASVTGRR